MIEILKHIALGIVQGLTEFLPVSSSGHIAVFQHIFGMSEDTFLALMLHMGTLIAVCVFYFKDLVALFKKGNRKTLLYLVIASVPAAAVMGVLKFGLQMDDLPTKYVCFGFLATGIILLLTEYIGKKLEDPERKIKGSSALIMGCAQAIAIIPGLSRSGSTIAAGVFTGTKREEVTKFSFFMSVPIILGSSLVEVVSLIGDPAKTANINVAGTLLGMLFAAVFGFIAIKFMIKIIAKCNFKWFSVYLFVLAILTFVFIFMGPTAFPAA